MAIYHVQACGHDVDIELMEYAISVAKETKASDDAVITIETDDSLHLANTVRIRWED